MPRGIWNPLTLEGADNQDMPEFFIKGGAIIPSGPVMQYTTEKPLDPLTLIVALDKHGMAKGTLYEDSGDGYEFERGDYLLSTYTAMRKGDTVEVSLTGAKGEQARPDRSLHVRLIMENGEEVTAHGRDGETIKVKLPN